MSGAGTVGIAGVGRIGLPLAVNLLVRAREMPELRPPQPCGYRLVLRVAYVNASYGGRWDVYSGSTRIGYAKASYGGAWDV